MGRPNVGKEGDFWQVLIDKFSYKNVPKYLVTLGLF